MQTQYFFIWVKNIDFSVKILAIKVKAFNSKECINKKVEMFQI